MTQTEFEIRLVYDRRSDGRFHIHSPNIPGLHVSGDNLEKITPDIEPLVRDLLLHNLGVVVDTLRWIPPLEELIQQLRQAHAEPHQPASGDSRVLIITGRAA